MANKEEKDEKRAVSFYHDPEKAEWRGRPISIVGAAKSFVSQLGWGADLTKTSLPSLFCAPFSGTESVGAKCLEFWSGLDTRTGYFATNTGVDRLKGVVAWYLSIVQPEANCLKPFNPVLGEQHWAWTDDPELGQTRFFLEQVSHHPPLAAWRVENSTCGVTINGNVGFSAAFFMNSVAVKGVGFTEVVLEKWGEKVSLSSPLPDMAVKNMLMPGPRRLVWESKIQFTCKETGCSAEVEFKEDNNYKNIVVGHITDGKKRWEIRGQVGGKIHISATDKIEVVKENTGFFGSFWGSTPATPVLDPSKSALFVDAGQANQNRLKVIYPAPEDLQPNSSLVLWKPVAEAIRKGDLEKADLLKIDIEANERKKRTSSNPTKIQFFYQEKDNNWYIKNDKVVKEFPLYK